MKLPRNHLSRLVQAAYGYNRPRCSSKLRRLRRLFGRSALAIIRLRAATCRSRQARHLATIR
jgi:hypothetical protein